MRRSSRRRRELMGPDVFLWTLWVGAWPVWIWEWPQIVGA